MSLWIYGSIDGRQRVSLTWSKRPHDITLLEAARDARPVRPWRVPQEQQRPQTQQRVARHGEGEKRCGGRRDPMSTGHDEARPAAIGQAHWVEYVSGFHNSRPGITERLLTPATDARQWHPYEWAVEPLRAVDGLIVDLACGSAPTRQELPDARWLGIDASAGELAAAVADGRGPVVRGRADRLPIRDGVASAVCAAMCLPVVTPLPAVLAEVRRVLRPDGTLVALVPARTPPARGLVAWARVMHTLGIRSQSWPNPDARDGLPGILSRCGFCVQAADRDTFWREIGDPDAAALLIDGLYLPDVPPGRLQAARTTLGSWAGPGRLLPFPLLRIVAQAAG